MADFVQRDFLDMEVLGRLARLNLNARHPMLGTVTGMHKSAARGSSVEFAEYRKYVPGDDVKHIDWQVYARTDRFYIKGIRSRHQPALLHPPGLLGIDGL